MRKSCGENRHRTLGHFKDISIACIILIIGLIVRSLCSKKLYNFKMLLWSKNIMKISGRMSFLLTLHIFKIIVDSFSPIVSAYVLNQSSDNWLFINTLQFAITMCLKFKENITNLPIHVCLLGDVSKVILECVLLPSNIKRSSLWSFIIFPFFSKNMKKEKVHNMLSIM